MPVNRAGNPDETQAERIARLRREEAERQQRAEQERIAQEREEREALEVERLQQLADAQPDASLFHGEHSCQHLLLLTVLRFRFFGQC